ncbi:hypothetical protein [Plesiocystis pacifica]|uniref:hypothetical protein n=1 Tax=Plesiocystis pacifica TaxID=191768 RepID=UPI0012F86AC0|nr:hypothetical protein [Plesiocystis pacifica]
MPLAFSRLDCELYGVRRAALVITPTTHLRVPLERLDQLRAEVHSGTDAGAIEANSVNATILDNARSARVQFTIFRGRDEAGLGSWGFDPDIDDASARELAYYLLRGQMQVYRGLVAAGLLLHLHVEWPTRELRAYQAALQRRRRELREAVRAAGGPSHVEPIDLVDLWILRHMTLFFGVGLDTLLDPFLAESLPIMERRIVTARHMLRQAEGWDAR